MSTPLRALLLAAGLGTRLRPITDSVPKCLVDIGGQPILGIWLTKLEEVGCESVIINTHYLSEQVSDFLASWKSSNMTIELAYEPRLLGTAGTLVANRHFFRDATGLLIHSDNFMHDSLEGLLSAHGQRPSDCPLTMLTFTTASPSTCGIVSKDNRGVITSFHEKDPVFHGTCANGAVFAFEPNFPSSLPPTAKAPFDFSADVIPTLIGSIYSWHTQNPFIDIGTPESLARANAIFS